MTRMFPAWNPVDFDNTVAGATADNAYMELLFGGQVQGKGAFRIDHNGNVTAASYNTGTPLGPGTDITVTLQNEITALPAGGGLIEIPAGTFTISALLKPVTGLKLIGQGANVTKLVSTTGGIFDVGNASTDGVEIGYMTLDATGGDIFGGATVNAIRWYVHDCIFQARSAGNAIWNGQIPSGGPGVMIECSFRRNQHHYHGATRTIEAWVMVGDSGANAVNQNSWQDEVFFNDDADASEYAMRITATTQVNSANTFRNIVFEHPYGGMIKLESHSRAIIEQCIAWDLTSAVAQHLVSISKSSGGSIGLGNTIINSPRNSSATFTGGAKDIVLDANCPQTTIIAPQYAGSGTGLLIDGGGSTGITLTAMPGTYTFTNGPTVKGRSVFQGNDATVLSVVTVQQLASAPAQTAFQIESAAAAENALGIRATGDTTNRLRIDSNGKHSWSSGSAAPDTALQRGAAGLLQASTDASGGTFKAIGINDMMELFRARTGSLGQTLPRTQVTVATAAVTTSGTVYLVGITLPAGTTVSNITFMTGITILKTGGTHGWYILCNASRVVLAATADQTDASTVWGTASTEYTLPIANAGGNAQATFTTTYTGLYYLGVMVANSTGTQPNFCSSAAQVAGIGLAPILSGASATVSQTTPPATDGSVTIGAISNDSTKMFYGWVS